MATSELTLRIGADPTKLRQGLNRSLSAVDGFATRTKATIQRLGGALNGVADKLVNPVSSLLLGGGMGIAIKNVGDLSQALMYYGMAAKKSDADTKVFRESLHQMAVQTGVDANTILAGVARIGEITGDFAFSEEMGSVLARAAKASGASVEELASVASSMKVSMGWGAEQISQAFNSLIIQGDQGSYTLQKFAGEGKALLAATSSFGIKSADQFANFGAYLQVMNAQIKSEAELTTSVSALFSELISKSKDLKKVGVQVFDAKGELRDFDAIMRQLMEKTNGDVKKITPLFGESARKALQPVMAEYKNGWQTLDAITKSGQEGMTNTAALDARFQKTADDFNTNVEKMKAVAVQFADVNLAGPVSRLSDSLQFLADHQGIVTAGFKAMTVAALALGAVKLGGLVNQVRGFAGEIKSIWTGKVAGGDALGSAVDASAVQKVFVVNMGSGMGSASYYQDDDELPSKNNAKEVATATKETGRFRSAMSGARAGLNKLGNSALGMGALTAATGWAIGKIYEFGDACVELYNTAKDVKAARDKLQAESNKTIEERYGYEAAYWARQKDIAFNAMQDELNSLFYVNQEKVDRLQAEMNSANEKMKAAIKKGGRVNESVDAKAYMSQFNTNFQLPPQTFNVYVDPSHEKAVVETDGAGKPPKVKVKNTPNLGR